MERKNENLSAILALLVYFISLVLSPYGVLGDQYFYRLFYEATNGLSYFETLRSQRVLLSSGEPVYGSLVYLARGIISKDFFNSILNAALAYSTSSYLLRDGFSRILSIVLVLFSFYAFVLYFHADRLKISLLFFFLAMNATGSRRAFFLIVAPLAHVQILILYLCAAMNFLMVHRLRSKIKEIPRITIHLAGVLFLFFVIFGGLISEHALRKVSNYYRPDIQNSIKPGVFMILAMFLCRKKTTIFITFLPVLLSSIAFGSGRIVMFAYFIFLYMTRSLGGLSLLINYVVAIYFVNQGYDFIIRLIEDGDGFSLYSHHVW